MRTLVATVLIGLCLASTAEGQAGAPWLVLPSTASTNATWAEPAAKAFRRELYDRGIDVWALDRASARFEKNGSAAPAQLSDSALEDWEAQSHEALVILARGQYAEALDQLDEAQRLSRSAPEALNRDPKRAEKVLGTCLYVVRGLLATGSILLAEQLAQECRQLVLQGTPSPAMHPPNVLETLGRVDAGRAEQKGALYVESRPSGCSVRVNGLQVGETPVDVGQLYPGRYRVQVECAEGEAGRVHTADVGFAQTDVFVDARFDSVVRTKPLLSLRYPDTGEGAQHQLGDAERITAIVPAGALILMDEAAPGVLKVQLLRGVPLGSQALVLVRAGPRGPRAVDAAVATAALINGDCKDFTEKEPQTIPCSDSVDFRASQLGAVDDLPDDRTPRGRRISGLALAGVGSAALLTGYVLLAPRASVAESWVDSVVAGMTDTAKQQQWLNLGWTIAITSAVGATALVAAMPLALPKRDKPPWWAWLSGGLGLGLAAFSVAYGSTAGSEPSAGCSEADLSSADAVTCVRRGEHVSLAVLTGVTAAPALTVPLVYLFRRKSETIQPHVSVSRRVSAIGIRGRF
jgi:hypothetical protein